MKLKNKKMKLEKKNKEQIITSIKMDADLYSRLRAKLKSDGYSFHKFVVTLAEQYVADQ